MPLRFDLQLLKHSRGAVKSNTDFANRKASEHRRQDHGTRKNCVWLHVKFAKRIKAFEVVIGGKRHTFDSFECAIHALGAGLPALQLSDRRARR
jgi:hypothetical protein